LSEEQEMALSAGKFILIFVMATVLFACSQQETKPKERPPLPVAVANVGRKDVPVQLQAVGTVRAQSIVAVRAQVGGELARVHFREGEEVRAGEILFTIDPRPFRAELAQAEAELAANLAEQENARDEARRYEDLLRQGFVSRQEFDRLASRAAALEGRVKSFRAAVENARLQLEYCTIRSPLTGRAGSLLVHPGNLVKANDENPLVVIHRMEPVEVAFSVPERNLSAIKEQLARGDLAVEAFSRAEATAGEKGKVTFLDNSVDSSTGTILLKGTFANTGRRLWPGEFVTVRLTLNELTAVPVVPSRAVQTGQQGNFIFIVKGDGTVEMRPVTTSIAYGEETVLTQGATPGETVVTEGQQRLFPGAKVAVKDGAQAAAAENKP
jgi:multidrug efflux system membrane fusion protein